MDFWCDKQAIDEKGVVICLAHLAEGRALNCPWKSNDERVKAEYLCSECMSIEKR